MIGVCGALYKDVQPSKQRTYSACSPPPLVRGSGVFNSAGGGGSIETHKIGDFGKGAQLIGPSISYDELWR